MFPGFNSLRDPSPSGDSDATTPTASASPASYIQFAGLESMNKLRISSTGSLAGKGVANSSQLQINSQTSPGSKPISIPPKPSSSSSTFGKDDYRTTEQKYGPAPAVEFKFPSSNVKSSAVSQSSVNSVVTGIINPIGNGTHSFELPTQNHIALYNHQSQNIVHNPPIESRSAYPGAVPTSSSVQNSMSYQRPVTSYTPQHFLSETNSVCRDTNTAGKKNSNGHTPFANIFYKAAPGTSNIGAKGHNQITSGSIQVQNMNQNGAQYQSQGISQNAAQYQAQGMNQNVIQYQAPLMYGQSGLAYSQSRNGSTPSLAFPGYGTTRASSSTSSNNGWYFMHPQQQTYSQSSKYQTEPHTQNNVHAQASLQNHHVQTPQNQINQHPTIPQTPHHIHTQNSNHLIRDTSSRTASSAGYTDASNSYAPTSVTIPEEDDKYEDFRKLSIQLSRKNMEVELLAEEVKRLNELLGMSNASPATVVPANHNSNSGFSSAGDGSKNPSSSSYIGGSGNNSSSKSSQHLPLKLEIGSSNEGGFIVIGDMKHPISYGVEVVFRQLTKLLQEKTEHISKLQCYVDAAMASLSAGAVLLPLGGLNHGAGHPQPNPHANIASPPPSSSSSTMNNGMLGDNLTLFGEHYKSVDQVELANRIVARITTLQEENNLLGKIISQGRCALKETELKLLREENSYLRIKLEQGIIDHVQKDTKQGATCGCGQSGCSHVYGSETAEKNSISTEEYNGQAASTPSVKNFATGTGSKNNHNGSSGALKKKK